MARDVREEDTNLHEFVIAQLHPAIPIRVNSVTGHIESGQHEAARDARYVPLERFGERFNDNACTHEAIERNSGWWTIPAHRRRRYHDIVSL